jgi:parallel beta-helix repeat protein
MAWPSIVLPALGKLRDWYTQLNTYFATCKTLWDSHIAGTADRHTASSIINDSSEVGNTISDALNNSKSKTDTHIAGTANKHAAQDILHDGPAGGSNVQIAINNLKADIGNLTTMPGTEHDPLVTEALVDEEGTDFGADGLATYLDGRLSKWEQKSITHWGDNTKHRLTVNNFGAKGDGVTDDTAAFNLAFSTLDTMGGGEMYIINNGNPYIISGKINLYSNIYIVGIGNPIVKLKDHCDPVPDYLFATEYDGTEYQNISITGVTIDGNRDNNIVYGPKDGDGHETIVVYIPYAAIALSRVTDFKIDKNTIINMWGMGIDIQKCCHGNVTNNILKDYRITGIHVTSDETGGSDHVNVCNNHVSGGIIGIHAIFGVHYINIENNTVSNNTEANAYPSFAYQGTYPNMWPTTGDYVQISPALTVNQGDGSGIELTGENVGGDNNTHINISGNIAHMNKVGIRLEEATENITIGNNDCCYNELYGISLGGSIKCTVAGNNCCFNEGNGINLQHGTNRICAYNSVSGNTCTDNGDMGICLVGSQDNTISGNTIFGNNTKGGGSGGGLALYVASEVGCVGNSITGNSIIKGEHDVIGILASGELNTRNVVVGNVIRGFGISNQLYITQTLNTVANNSMDT